MAEPMTTGIIPDDLFESIVGLLDRLCTISSASGDAAGIGSVGELLGERLKTFGLTSRLQDSPGSNGSTQPVLVSRGAATDFNYSLVLGHLDTVLPAIPPGRDGSRMLGTGALDMKGGLAAFVGALELIRRRGEPIPDDLLFVGVPDEEVGGPISEHMVRTWGESARALMVLEPGELRPHSETLVTGRRGIVVWRLEGRGRAAHSGVSYWDGRSALAAAATWCGAVQRMSEEGAGPLVNVGRIVGGDSEFVQDLGEEHHFVGTSQRLNVVPDRCIAEGELRFLQAADADNVLNRMRELAAQLAAGWGVELDLEVVETLPPVNPDGPGAGLARRLVRTAADTGWSLELESDRGGVSFANFLPDPSKVTILDGLGPGGGGMHTRDEYVDLNSLRRRIHLIAEAIRLVSAARV